MEAAELAPATAATLPPPHGAPTALPTAHWLGGLFPWRHPGFFCHANELAVARRLGGKVATHRCVPGYPGYVWD
eukprot:COSAG02_NODE_44492_length_365_cov_2.387218_1_plen_73_part_10